MIKNPFVTLNNKINSELGEDNKVIFVKVRSEYVDDIISGKKKSELRKNDREYSVGDLLYLQEITEDNKFTGRLIIVKITHILQDEEYLQKDYACLSIEYIKTISNK